MRRKRPVSQGEAQPGRGVGVSGPAGHPPEQIGPPQRDFPGSPVSLPGHLSPLMNGAIQFHCSKAVVQGSPDAGTCKESQPMNNSAIITDAPNTVACSPAPQDASPT